MLSSYPTATFDPNASYLIAGGLGGLGRSLVSWMAARGARFFVAMSRSVEMSPQASAFIQRLHMQGITVEPVACDITVRSEVEMTVSRALSKRVVKGVVHMAMVLRDKLFANLSIEEWRTGLAAKVQGTLNLHEATRNIPLDFFVMASSISTQIAQPTQAAYCAANSFQDQFARHRRSQGLPATTIAFGLIHEVGELGRRVDVQNSMSRNDLYATREAGFLHLLEAAFLPQVEDGNDHYDPLCTAQIVTSLEPALLLAKQHENRGAGITTNPRWHSDLRFSHIIRETETLATNTKAVNAVRNQGSLSAPIPPRISLDACMRAGKVEEANHIVLGSVVKRIAEMLFIAPDSLDPNLSVSAYGIDSLVAAELRSWFIAAYDSRISFLTLLDTRLTIFNLASYVVNEWVETNSSIAKAK
jgi:NAD(P)-dependent dehydrogenase (short-subunit alcohol dehydrogenase family)